MTIRSFLHGTGDLVASVLQVRKRLTDAQKVQVGGLSLSLGGVGLAMGVNAIMMAFPDRVEMAEKWAKANGEDYTNLCYTDNPQTETGLSTPNRAMRQVQSTFNMLSSSGPIGRDLTKALTQADTIFCFGPRHKSGADFHRPAPARDIYFTANDIADMDIELASHLFQRRGLGAYVNDRVDIKQNRFITPSALIWKRSVTAIKPVILADATYHMLEEAGVNVFNQPSWLKLESVDTSKDAALAYKDAILNGAGVDAARKTAFYQAYASANVQQGSDRDFVQWYAGQVDEQAVIRTRSVPSTCSDGKGGTYSCMATQTYTDYEDPPYYVHSEDLHPATLAALSDIFMDGAPFLSLDEAQAVIDDPASLFFHDDATRRSYANATKNAKNHASGHYQGESTSGRGLNVDISDLELN